MPDRVIYNGPLAVSPLHMPNMQGMMNVCVFLCVCVLLLYCSICISG